MTVARSYLRSKVMSATPAELRLLLFDGALRFIRQGIDGLQRGDHEASYEGISKTQAIIAELLAALDPTHAPDLCDRLSGLYTFMYTELVDALSEGSVDKAVEVQRLLEYERETWLLLIDQLANENASAANTATNAPANSVGATPSPMLVDEIRGNPNLPTSHGPPDDLIGGRLSLHG